MKAKYEDTIELYVKKGRAKQLPLSALDEQSQITWYFPHHPVMHPHKEKVRVVFDYAAKVQGTSLNDKLVTGPDQMNSIIGVLTRFRESPIALLGDVEKMFHQVYVGPEHRNALRFLWWLGGNLEEHPVPHQITVHIFGSRSSPISIVRQLLLAPHYHRIWKAL